MKIDESVYDSWVDIYDLLYSGFTADIPFYVEESLSADGPVLELGCGTGRVSIPIASQGVNLTCLDISRGMIGELKRKISTSNDPTQALRVIQGDMRDFTLDSQFDLVIIPFRSFLYLLSVEDQVRTLINIKRHLSNKGKLILNFFVPDLQTMNQEGDLSNHLFDVTDPNTGCRLVVWNQTKCDMHTQILDTRLIIEMLNDDGLTVKRLHRDVQLRYVYRWEMYHLLKYCGYRVVDLYGDFNRTPFDEESEEMIWIASSSQ